MKLAFLILTVINIAFAASVEDINLLRFIAVIGWFCVFGNALIDLAKWMTDDNTS